MCKLFQMRVLFAWDWLADISGDDGCWLSLELNNRNLINKEEWEDIPEGKYYIIWECKCISWQWGMYMFVIAWKFNFHFRSKCFDFEKVNIVFDIAGHMISSVGQSFKN